MIFLDENAACQRTGDRKYEWSLKKIIPDVYTHLKKSKRWFILPAFTIKGYITSMIYQGSITADLFLDFVKNDVLPLCTRTEFKGPNSVIIMNNAKIHMSSELNKMCEEAGVILTKLPSYLFDYNSIKTSFAVLKQWIKKHEESVKYYEETDEDFERFLRNAVDAQNERIDPGTLFRAAGIQYGGNVQ